MSMKQIPTRALLGLIAGMATLSSSASAAVIGYVDLGYTTTPPAGKFVTNLPGSPKVLSVPILNYDTGVEMGTISIPRNDTFLTAGSAGTPEWGAPGPASDHFGGIITNENGAGYSTGTQTFTISDLDPDSTYILTVGARRSSSSALVAAYTLGGAETYTNTSTGSAVVLNAGATSELAANTNDIVQWSGITTADGTLTLDWAQGGTNTSFIYISALSLEQVIPEPAALSLVAAGGLLLRRRAGGPSVRR